LRWPATNELLFVLASKRELAQNVSPTSHDNSLPADSFWLQRPMDDAKVDPAKD